VRFWALLVVLATLAFLGASSDEAAASSAERASRIVDAEADLAARRAVRPAEIDTFKVSGIRRAPSRVLRATEVPGVHTTLGRRAARRVSVPTERWRHASILDRVHTHSMVLLN
jgi:hypothetical protein